MLEEIVLAIGDEPETLALIGELLGASGVNIHTLSATTYNGQGVVHLVCDDGDDAAEVLKSNGFTVRTTRPVMTATVDDQPGELGRYCRRLTDAGVIISAAYVARKSGGETELIFAVDDLDLAQEA